MRTLLVGVLLLAGCPPPARSPRPVERAGADGTCAEIAWSCVGLTPGGDKPWGCTEGNASHTAQYQATCTQDKHGLFTLGACLRDNIVGGCTVARGSQCTTTWFFAPAVGATVEADCAKQGALFVPP